MNKEEFLRLAFPKLLTYRLKQLRRSAYTLYTFPVQSAYELWNTFWKRKK